MGTASSAVSQRVEQSARTGVCSLKDMKLEEVGSQFNNTDFFCFICLICGTNLLEVRTVGHIPASGVQEFHCIDQRCP